MDKSQSGSASPAPLSSSPALRSTPTIPETTVTATEESPSASAADQSRRMDAAPPPPPSSKSGSLRGTAEPQDTDRSPLNVYAQAATSTISEWFGTSVCAVYCDPPLPAIGGGH